MYSLCLYNTVVCARRGSGIGGGASCGFDVIVPDDGPEGVNDPLGAGVAGAVELEPDAVAGKVAVRIEDVGLVFPLVPDSGWAVAVVVVGEGCPQGTRMNLLLWVSRIYKLL